jgi:phenylacetate-CoA ligase
MNILIRLTLRVLSIYRRLLECSPATMNVLFIPGFERLRWRMGKLKAQRQYQRALYDVPAYRHFVGRQLPHEASTVQSKRFEHAPVMDKFSYVRKYAPSECCHGGKIPTRGIMIDESSGSTGVPTNWVRSKGERRANQRYLEFALQHVVGTGPRFIVNAFALGPWATGINVSMAFTDSSILKSLGPDPLKIANTLRFFGAAYKYVIMGYPPFLKSLVDTAGIDWHGHDITFIYGGESMSEAMRGYILSRGVKRVYGSYGASDLELNIGSENDFTIALRRLLEANKELASRIVRYAGTMPMIFQYNPMDFYIETTEQDELLITLCRPTYVAPKIRYNIHDRGHVMRLPELKKILGECGIAIGSLGNPASDLPLLFHYGRADMTVAYYGSKVSPADVQEAMFRVPGLPSKVGAFTMMSYENQNADKRLSFSLECLPEIRPADVKDGFLGRRLIEELMVVNQDFRESMRIAGSRVYPDVEFHKHRTGPFANNDARIKLNYITRVIDQPLRIAAAL